VTSRLRFSQAGNNTTNRYTKELCTFLLWAFVCSGVVAEDFVPFVIPAKPNPDSAIAATSAKPIDTDSDRLIADGHFYRGGQRVRLWGVNLSFGANFPKHEDAPYVAARLAAAGVNAVRCHHMDTARWPRGIWNAEDGKTISAEALDRLDFFIDQLARHGIYVNVNLHVGRAHSEYLGLPKTNRQYDKVCNIFAPALIEAQKQYARELLTHINKYRKVRYADDPAVAIVEITNENSFFMWDGDKALRALQPYYADVLQGKFNAWLRQQYGADANNVALFPDGQAPEQVLDRMRFLAETEKAHFDDMRKFIKNELGCKALVTGTIVFGPLGLYAQSDMDFIDTHAYWQHPRFPGRPWDSNNWIVEQRAMTDYPQEATLFRLAAQRLAGKPFTVSEYNHPAPLDSQAECVPMIASFAAAQDWDGVWLYAYSHGTDSWDREVLSGYFDVDTNPGKWGFMRAGAAIFRDVDIAPLGGFIIRSWTGPAGILPTLAKLHLKYDGDMLRALGGQPETTIREMLKIQLVPVIGNRDGHRDVFGPAAKLEWSVEDGKGLFCASGRGAQVYVGHAGRFKAATQGKIVVIGPSFVALTVTALDGRVLDQSQRILVTACGRCENTGMKFSEDRRTVGTNWGSPPVQIEAVEGSLRLDGRWICRALGPDGLPKHDVVVSTEAGQSLLKLSPEYGTMWYLLTRAANTDEQR
jgi:hypothetical protein